MLIMITGFDYVFLSNRKQGDVERQFITKIKSCWPMLIVEELLRTETSLELFFSKNEKMVTHHDQYGYALDDNGEGCFMLYARQMSISCNAHLSRFTRPEELTNASSYSAVICFEAINEYTLVLPAERKLRFPKLIYNFMVHSMIF